MKIVRVFLLALLAGVLAEAQTAPAAGWSLGNLIPFAKSDKAKSTRKKSSRPSAIQQVGTGTKKVVTTSADLLTLKWLVPKQEAPKPDYKWSRTSHQKKPEKKPFLDFLFPPKEPPAPKTLTEWMAQERLEP